MLSNHVRDKSLTRANGVNKKTTLVFALILLHLFLSKTDLFCQQPALLDSPNQILQKTLTKKILDNGLAVIIKEEHTHPLVTIMATINAGLSSEGAYSGCGISHFIEHMVFKGTSKRKPGQIEQEVKSYGGVINGSTDLDNATYCITVPKEYTTEALELIEDIIFHPAFDVKEMEKEREVILKEIKLNRDDPTRRVMKLLWQTAYLEHPYKLPVIGYEDLFKRLQRDDLVKYHSLHYTPDNLILTVVGDIDKDKVLLQIKSVFEKYKKRGGLSVAVPYEPQQNSSRETKDSAQINLGYLAMGYHTVELVNNDLYALDVLSIILGDWDGSRLNKKLVKDAQLLYTVGSFNYTPKYPGLFIIYGVGNYKELEKAKLEILEEIKRIDAEGVEESQLHAAKNIVISDYINFLETTQGLARAISQGEFLAGDPAFFEKYVANIKKVDAEIVRDAARKYLNENNLTISYLYPDYAPTEKEPSEKEEETKTLPQKILLSNGIQLILKEDHRLPKVSLVCAFLGGVRVETEKNNGISNLTSLMLLKGTKNRKESEIKAFLESRGGGISHFSGKNTFGISLEFLSKDAHDALDVLEDVIKNPTFPEEELQKEKEKLYAAIKAEEDDIYSMGFLKLQKALFENYPYGLRVIGEADSLKKITRKNIENFYKDFCVSNNLVISVVGDFESQKMRNDIEKRLFDMRKAPLDIKIARVTPLVGIREINYDMAREQSLIVVGFRGTTIDCQDKYRLQVLSSILSGENGRLYQSIRNELGLSYSLGAFSTPGMDTGYIASYVATDRKHLKEAKELLFTELKKIREGAISEEEVKLAKSALIGGQKISLQIYNVLAYQMALDQIYGIGYDAYRNYPQFISNVKRADVIEASKKYIDLQNFASVTVSGRENK